MIDVISQVIIITFLVFQNTNQVKVLPKPTHQDAIISVSKSKDKLDKKHKLIFEKLLGL